MRRHSWSGATALVALSLAVGACGEKGSSAPGVTSPSSTTPAPTSPLALAKSADTLTVDESLQLSAIIPPLPGVSSSQTTWTSSDPSVAIVTQNGVIFALKSGKTTITVTTRGATATTVVTVRPTIREVAFDSDTTAISVSESARLPYRVVDTDGGIVDLSTHNVVWTSDAPDIAPLTGGATVTGVALGRTAVSLSVDGHLGRTHVKVLPKPVATVQVAPANAALLTGQTIALVPKSTDVNGNTLTNRAASWSSSSSSVATVSADGHVTAVAVGHADITATVEGVKGVVPVTVSSASSPSTPAPVATVAVTLNAPSITVGQTTQANASLKDGSSNLLTGRTIAWASSDPTIATVTASGLVTAVKAGSVSISAMAEGKSGSASLTTTAPATAPAAVASVSVTLGASSSSIGGTTQASVQLKDASGTVLSGRAVTWVSSDATIASVSSSGLVTAIKAGSVSITASSEGKTGSALFTTSAPLPQVHFIALATNAQTIKIGERTQITGVVKDVNGGDVANVPIIWSATPTTVGTTTTTGMLTGRGVGQVTVYARADTVTRSIAVTVIDSATSAPPVVTTPPPTGTPVVVVPGPTYGPASPAELPRVNVATGYPSMSRQVRVPAGASLQAAIDAAQPGDELLLAPGAQYVGNFTLPNKGSNGAWIVIRTDVPDATLGAPGTRMTPSRAASARLAKILSPNNQSTIGTDLSANHYRFTGVEIGATSGASDINAMVRFGSDGYDQTPSTTANNLIVDRSYVHGNATLEVRRCVLFNSATSAVVDSWLGDCHSNVSDSQAIVGWNGPGPFLIQNNYLEAGHEVIAFGGGTFTVQGGSPSDITIRGNHITRPLAWKGIWQVKNLFETKHAKRVLVEGNMFENNWQDAQAGFAILIKSVNQQNDNPWTQSADVTIRYNHIRNTGNVFNLAGTGGDGLPDVKAARVAVYDNLIESVNIAPYSADGIPYQLLNGISDVAIFHNTMLNSGPSLEAVSFDGDPIQRLAFHSNASYNGQYGVFAAGGAGSTALRNYAPGSLFAYVLLVGGDCSALPATTSCPSSMPSSFAMGYDGRAIGADVNQVNSQTRNAVVAP